VTGEAIASKIILKIGIMETGSRFIGELATRCLSQMLNECVISCIYLKFQSLQWPLKQ